MSKYLNDLSIFGFYKIVGIFSFLCCREAEPSRYFLRCTDDGFSYRVLCEGGYSLGSPHVSHVLVVAPVVADMPETGVHLAAELGHVAQHTDRPGDATARVEDVVLTSYYITSYHNLKGK